MLIYEVSKPNKKRSCAKGTIFVSSYAAVIMNHFKKKFNNYSSKKPP